VWRKFWLLFTVIALVVAAIHAGTILALEEEHARAWRVIGLTVLVCAGLFAVGLAWEWLQRKLRRISGS
jgi:hypothetical protein